MTQLENQQKIRKERREKGLCIYCGQDAIKGKSYCVDHWLQNIKSAKKSQLNNVEKRKKYHSDRRAKFKDEGRCPKCGVMKNPESDGNNSHCSNCSAGIHKKYYS